MSLAIVPSHFILLGGGRALDWPCDSLSMPSPTVAVVDWPSDSWPLAPIAPSPVPSPIAAVDWLSVSDSWPMAPSPSPHIRVECPVLSSSPHVGVPLNSFWMSAVYVGELPWAPAWYSIILVVSTSMQILFVQNYQSTFWMKDSYSVYTIPDSKIDFISSGRWDFLKAVTLNLLVWSPSFFGITANGAVSLRNSQMYPAVDGSPSCGDDFSALLMSFWENVIWPSMLPTWIHTTGFLLMTVSDLKKSQYYIWKENQK